MAIINFKDFLNDKTAIKESTINSCHYRCVLVSLASGRLRDEVVEGGANFLPEPGEPFRLISTPKDGAKGYRLIDTSPVGEIMETVKRDGQKIIKFKTFSGSIYIATLVNNRKPIVFEREYMMEIGGF